MPPHDYSKLIAAAWDGSGENVECAVALAKRFKKVYYFTQCWESYEFEAYAVGRGMAKNIEKVDDFMEPINSGEVDGGVFFFDIGEGNLCDFLRRHLKVPVYGAGRGEVLEKYRDKCRRLQLRLGLPTQETHFIVGLEKLERFVEKEKGKWLCKFNIFRNLLETFPLESFDQAVPHFNRLDFYLGPYAEEQLFTVEEKIEGVKAELGIDGFFNGKKFLRPIMWGKENGIPYIGRFSETLPPFFEDFIEKITPVLRECDYRGAISCEMLAMSKDEAYLIDMTTRQPSPLGICHTEAIENYVDVVMACARGEDSEIKPRGKYIAGSHINIPHTDKNWVMIEVEEKLRHKIKFVNGCASRGHYYIPHGIDGKVWVMSVGNSIAGVVKDVENSASKVTGFDLDSSHIGDLRSIQKEVEKYSELGIEF